MNAAVAKVNAAAEIARAAEVEKLRTVLQAEKDAAIAAERKAAEQIKETELAMAKASLSPPLSS